jgi:hypothetical protein
MGKLVVQSLWVGNKLSRMEHYSIKSFLVLGYTFHLYTYEHVDNVPKGTIIKDANEIMKKKDVFSLKSSFLPFSDIWRYKLLYLKGGYWVDLDMIAIRRFDFKEPFVFSSERTIQEGAFKSQSKLVPNIGILKAPAGSEFFKEAYEKSIQHNKIHTNEDKIKYMRIFRNLVKKYNYQKYVKPPKYFCNLDWWNTKEAYQHIKGRFPTKYGVKGETLNSMFNGPYTVHFWRDRSTKKYNIDIDAKHHPQSLWELMIDYIDTYGGNSHVAKLNKRTKKRLKGGYKKNSKKKF